MMCACEAAHRGLRCMKNVSCMSRAGWSGAKFSEENTCQSSSISGPSAMVKPSRRKMSTISSRTRLSGWRVPMGMGEGVRVRSRPAGSSSLDDSASRRPLMVSVARSLSRLSNCPISFFWSAGTVRKSLKSEAIRPFLLRYLMRSSSTSAGVEAVSACISLLRFSMRCFIAEKCI